MFRVLAALLVLGFAYPGEHRQVPAHRRTFKGPDRARGVPAAEQRLSRDIAGVIKKAERINIYRLAAFAADPGAERPAGKTCFADYEVLDFSKVDKRKASKLKKILLNEQNYARLGDANKCTFTATVGLEIVSKKGGVTALVSYRCEKILFLRDGQELYRDVKSLKRFDEIARGLLKGTLE
jgi:tRNA U55 pseudouridine synthase TruB